MGRETATSEVILPREQDPRFLLQLSFVASGSTYIRFVRPCEALLEQAGAPDDLQARCRIVLYELVENAVKYSVNGRISLHLCVESARSVSAQVLVRNQPIAGHAQHLRTLVDAIARAPNKALFYMELLESSRHRQGAGLGLARIAHEARAALTVDEDASGVSVCARLTVEA